MENKKDIGKAFREKLDRLEKSPNERVWSAIHADLQKKKKRRFLFIPFWMKTMGIVSLGILSSLFVFKGNLKKTLFSTPKIENEDKRRANSDRDGKLVKNKPHRNLSNPEDSGGRTGSGDNLKRTESEAANSGVSTHPKSNTENSDAVTKRKTAKKYDIFEKDYGKANTKSSKKYALQQTSLKKKRKTARHSGDGIPVDQPNAETAINGKSEVEGQNQNPNDIIGKETTPATEANNVALSSDKTPTNEKPIITATDSLRNKAATLKEPSKKEKDSTLSIEMSRINIFVYASPTYAGMFSKKSPFDSRLNYNATKSEISWSYGAYASYQATPKWSLRFGLSKTSTSVVTEDAPVNISPFYSDINYTHFSNAAVYNMTNAASMDIVQEISYIEVPLELKYAIIDKNFGLNAYGGIGFKFLDKNEVYGKTPDGQTFRLGETKNLSTNSYSLNLGVGCSYKITRRIRFNVEPVFKFNAFDYKSLGKMKLYTIGVLSGLQFSLHK